MGRFVGALVVVLGLVAALVPLADPAGAAGSFDDTAGNTHEADIEIIAAHGITRGCNPPANNLYCPDDPVTRAQMASFLIRALPDLAPVDSGPFDDTAGNTHEADINGLAASGVTKGCNPPANTLYCPDDPVTRAQMASFLVRALNLTHPNPTTTTSSTTTSSTTTTSTTPTTSTTSTTTTSSTTTSTTTSTTSTTTTSTTTTTMPTTCTTEPDADFIAADPFNLTFDADDDGLCDSNDVGTGFSWVDPPSNGTGYLQDNLEVAGGELRVTTTAGLFQTNVNTQDNALAVGLEPQTNWKILTTLVDPPTPQPGNFQQAGVWFGNDEDNYVKLVVIAATNEVRIQLLSEVSGSTSSELNAVVGDLSSATVDLELSGDWETLQVTGQYRIDGGALQDVGSFTIPAGLFTDTYGGIMTSHRNGPNPLEYRFDSFGVETFESDAVGSWETKAPLPQAVVDAGSDVLGGLVYLVGGKTSETNRITTVFSYDPVSNSWDDTLTDIPGDGREDITVVAHDGLLYAFGGAVNSPFNADSTTTAVYDPATKTWNEAAAAALPVPLSGADGTVWNNKIWLVGGFDTNGDSVATIHIYDPATNTWDTGPSLPEARDNPAVAVLDGHLYVFGGRNRQGGSGPTMTTTWRLTDPTGSWEIRAAMPAARRSFLIGTAQSKAQLFGGESGTNNAISAVHEYNPATNTWTTLTAMPTGRHGPAGGTISGATYVAGGSTGSGSNLATTIHEAFTR
jgi:N-acetylneuraminic acid mutarotase